MTSMAMLLMTSEVDKVDLLPQPLKCWIECCLCLGQIETRPNIFGDSWKVFSSCPRAEEDPIHPCLISPNRAEWSKFSCGVLMNEPFEV